MPVRTVLARKSTIIDLSSFSRQWQPYHDGLSRGASIRQWICFSVVSPSNDYWPLHVSHLYQMHLCVNTRDLSHPARDSERFDLETKCWKSLVSCLVDLHRESVPLGNVVIVNLPQLLRSSLYLMYNGLFTCMLLLSEYNKFTIHRKSLRVSTPRSQQRSTYCLQLPWR